MPPRPDTGLITFTLETLGPDFLQAIYTPTSIFENLAPSSQIKPLLFVLMSHVRQHPLAWGWEGKSNPHNSKSYQRMCLCHRIKYGLQSATAVLEARGCRSPGVCGHRASTARAAQRVTFPAHALPDEGAHPAPERCCRHSPGLGTSLNGVLRYLL